MTVADDQGRIYAGRSSAARKADRRARFLHAGIEVMGVRGYAATSVAHICAAAGLARSQFYSEFANREALLVDVYDLIQDDALAAVVAALDGQLDRDRRALVVAAMTALVGSIGGDPRRARISYLEMLGVSDAVEQHRTRRRAQWVQFFENTLRSEVGSDFVPPGGYRLAATAFLGALTEIVSDWSRTDPPRPPIEHIVETMVAVLGAFVPDLN
ncbi:TetR/AcrR family transcriptional regulator [Rhodococcus ruber]|uniref:TetR/AcrR family transcriptional regulator n=1 Tax=Rhodococcus ruber TaxID=1830 RepID=A0ABT4MK45_9NOCA|nr:TetR/AcrR family transcriptional regulator [Rhodococcus ruber]MCZ4520096.1 TetR/AcrR family transcriptional regulator [Rhodococcus ruber]